MLTYTAIYSYYYIDATTKRARANTHTGFSSYTLFYYKLSCAHIEISFYIMCYCYPITSINIKEYISVLIFFHF